MRTWLTPLFLLAACGSSPVCEAGRQIACACPGGAEGFQVCEADGSAWGTCACDGSDDTEEPDTDAADTDGAETDAPTCDELGDCGDCIACGSEATTCATEWAACFAVEACVPLAECLFGCDLEPVCSNNCYGAAVGGESLASAAVECSREADCATACAE